MKLMMEPSKGGEASVMEKDTVLVAIGEAKEGWCKMCSYHFYHTMCSYHFYHTMLLGWRSAHHLLHPTHAGKCAKLQQQLGYIYCSGIQTLAVVRISIAAAFVTRLRCQ